MVLIVVVRSWFTVIHEHSCLNTIPVFECLPVCVSGVIIRAHTRTTPHHTTYRPRIGGFAWAAQMNNKSLIMRSASSSRGRPAGKNLPRGDLGGIDTVEPQASREG